MRRSLVGHGLRAAVIMSIIVTAVAPNSARADQVTDKKALAATLAQKINSDARQVEVLAESYNGAQYHLAQVQQQLADAERRLEVARGKAERNRVALADEAIVAYIHGGLSTGQTMKSFSGSVDLAVQQGYFRLATRNQADALDQLRRGERELRQQQLALQSARSDSQAAVAAVASRQHAVQAAADAGQATLNQVQGDLVQLVAEQQAQVAAKQQTHVGASLVAAQTKLEQTGVVVPAAPAPAPAPAVGALAGAGAGAGGTGTAPGAPGPASGNGAGSTPAPSAAPTTGGPVTAAPTTAAPPTTKAPKPPPPPPAPAPSSGVPAVLAYARAQIGKPYQWGASGPDSFDCSGLTMRAWEAAGVSLPHYARAQYANTAHVAIADLRPGDLVFFGSDLHHEGLYIGGGQMIEAPSTGEFVRVANIFRPDLQPYGGRPS